MSELQKTNNYITDIRQILESARQKTYAAMNYAMVEAYWLIGKRIVEEEQQGKERAEYGKEILQTLSGELTKEYGKGYSARNLWDFRKFYLTFSEIEILHTLCAKLSWSHIRLIMRVYDRKAQVYYFKEAAENNWSVRTLDRNISTFYYQRLLTSQLKEPLVEEMEEKTKLYQQDKLEFIKNPTVLEFIGLPSNSGYTEAELEKAIINELQKFILELGKGFAFVARQQLVRTETSDFYNYILKCFVIMELKTSKITHQDIGQLDMYVRMFDDLKKAENDNPTIGILLCSETDKTIAKYSVLNESKQLFASKYMPYLPTEEELVAEIERQRRILKLQFENDALKEGEDER
jgi:predicted nuclease of restriction endonuclease-like (RecB) superfamily